MKIIECEQGTPEWFMARMGKVTASNFKTVMAKGKGGSASVTRKKYMMKLIAETRLREPLPGYTNEAMQRGNEVEPQAREQYEKAEGCSVLQVGFVERDGDVGGSPDFLVGDDGMGEIKCPDPHTHLGYLRANRLPPAYKEQVQGGMWVCEREWCDFISFDDRLTKNGYFCKRIYRDDDFIKKLHIEVVMFVTEMKEIIAELDYCPF